MKWIGDPGFGVTVTVIRSHAGVPDDYGNPVPGADFATHIDGCLFAPNTSGDEIGPDGRVIVSPAAVYAAIGSDFRKDDRVVVRGNEWFVDGEPQEWDWDGRSKGVRVFLRRRS